MSMEINHRYRLLRELGRGGQGMVFEARDRLREDEFVALKVLTVPSFAAMLRREFEQVRRLEHPHLARAFDFGVVESIAPNPDFNVGAPFFTQELVRGTPANVWAAGLASNERMLRVVTMGVAVARALELIHRAGLIHRDIKPANILIEESGEIAKLIDFGLTISKHAVDGGRAGTMAFMAPEVLNGFPSIGSDIYSLGMTLIALIKGTKSRPSRRDLDTLSTDVSIELQSVLRRMTEPKSAQRYQSASDVVLALAKAVGASALGMETTGPIDAMTDTATPATRAARARSLELIGRETLTQRLLAWLEETPPAGTVPVAILSGPPGVGKTRLIRAVVVAWQLKCAKRGTQPPQLLSASLRVLIRMVSRDSGEMNQILANWLGDQVSDTKIAADAHGSERLVEAMTALLMGRLGQPTVIVIEGLETELEMQLCARIAREPASNAALSVILETRRQPAGDDAARWTPFTVPPLDLANEAALLETVIGQPLEGAFKKAVHELTGGIPALTEAVVLALMTKHPGAALSVSTLADLNLDEQPEKLMLGALELLSVLAKQLLEGLAVARVPLRESELAQVIEYDRAQETAEALEQLEARGCITVDGDQVVIGKLMADALYTTLDRMTLERLSRRVFTVLSKRPAPPWQLLTYAVSGGLLVDARHLGYRAYEMLKAAGDLEGATEALCKLLSILDAPREEQDRLTFELARLFRMTGRYDRVIETADAISPDSSVGSEAALERGIALRLSGKTEAALAIFDALSRSDDDRVALNARAQAARIELDQGLINHAANRFEQITLDALRAAGVSTLNTVGLIALYMGKYEQAKKLFDTGLTDAKTAGDLRSEARFCGLLGMVYHGEADWDSARGSYADALELATRAGDRHGAATYMVNLAAALTELGRLDEALVAYRDGLLALERFGRPAEIALAGANYAELLHRLGDLDGADMASVAALKQGRQSGHRPLVIALRVRGDVMRACCQYDEAAALLEEANAICEANQMSAEKSVVALALVSLEIDQGMHEDAAARLATVRDVDLAADDTRLERCRLQMNLALSGHGNLSETLAQFETLLPVDSATFHAHHLNAFVDAARGARRLGDFDKTRRYASAALSIQQGIREKTPSIYHRSDGTLTRELIRLQRLFAQNSAEESNAYADGDWYKLVRINTRINSEMRVGHLLDMVMDAALDITGAKRGFLLVVNAKGRLKVRCARNIDRRVLSADDANFSRTVAKRAFESAEPVLTTDALGDERFSEMRSVVNLNLRYIAAVPLNVKGVPTGTIYLDSRHGGHFDETRLSLLQALADQAAIALTNARLQTEVRRRQSKIEKLNRALAAKLASREGELEQVKEALEQRSGLQETGHGYDEIIARSKPMMALFHLLNRVVAGDFPVIIQGESGTGKELVARAIHFNSRRKQHAFIVENCAAIPDNLLESVLFGHVKGAFTGATTDNRGLFVAAHKGTLFLDEIADMPVSMQVKLLRVLQNGEVRPVGGAKVRKVDVRIVVATNADLKARVKAGGFREDLYYRLDVFDLHLPPLRERKEDIPILIDHFIEKHADKRKQVSPQALEALMDFHWPGNVRQLENEILRAVVLSDGQIGLDHLSEEVIQGANQISERLADFNLATQVDRLKIRLVSAAMSKVDGNQTAAAELLGLSRYGLQKMLKRYGLDRGGGHK